MHRRTATRAALAALALLAVLAPVAEAATTVGSALRQRANLYVRCAASCTDTQVARPGGTSLAVPVDGVLTTWRVRVASLGTVRLRLLRPGEDGGLRVVASSEPQRLDRPPSPGRDVLYTFAARLPVRRGDRLALDRDRRAGAVFHTYGNDTSWRTATVSPPPADGAPFGEPGPGDIGRELLLNADVEADADGDGFGDESQDRCPADPAAQAPAQCPGAAQAPGTTAAPGAVDVGGGGAAPGRGPEVRGEPSPERRQRRHGARPSPRARPPVRRTRPGAHPSRPAPRPAPRRARRDAERHGARPGARPTPRRTRPGAERHRSDRLRRSAPRRTTPSQERHRSRPARPGPRPPRQEPASRHEAAPRRSAPRRVRRPGPRRHAPRPVRPPPGSSTE